MIIGFSINFKKECFYAFKNDVEIINDLMTFLEAGKAIPARYSMEEAIEKAEENLKKTIGYGEEDIHNAKVDNLEDREKCYGELIEMINKELDKEESVRHSKTV
jgi:hypothetical protein